MNHIVPLLILAFARLLTGGKYFNAYCYFIIIYQISMQSIQKHKQDKVMMITSEFLRAVITEKNTGGNNSNKKLQFGRRW